MSSTTTTTTTGSCLCKVCTYTYTGSLALKVSKLFILSLSSVLIFISGHMSLYLLPQDIRRKQHSQLRCTGSKLQRYGRKP